MNINMLDDKNSHPRDKRIKFDIENHIYSVDEKKKLYFSHTINK